MKWLWLLIYDPLTALDLRGADGRPSWTKTVSAILAGVFLYLVVRNKGWPPWGQLVTFVSGIFGPGMFRLFLQRWNGGAQESRNITVTEKPFGPSTEEMDG